MITKTLYELLGVPVDAAAHQIKRAYRRLAKRMHPDKGGDAEKFAELTNAYDVLLSPERRERYDKTGFGGDAKKSDPDAALASMLAGFVMQAMQRNPMGCNPVATGREIVREQIIKLRQTEAADKEIARRFRHVARNVERTDGKENLIASVLENHAAGSEAHAAQMKTQADQYERVFSMFEAYRWTPDSQGQYAPSRPREIRLDDLLYLK